MAAMLVLKAAEGFVIPAVRRSWDLRQGLTHTVLSADGDSIPAAR